MTRIFYLSISGLTLWAAAVQWLPREGLRTELDFGPEQARAQSPASSPLFLQPPVPTEAALPTAGAATPAATAIPGYPATGSPAAAAPPLGAVSAAAATSTAFTQPPLSTTGPVAWQPDTQELESAKVVARVGGDVILAGEVMASVKGYLARNNVDPNEPGVAEQVEQLMRMRLKQMIETRLVVYEARRKIPAEGWNNAMKKFDEEFDNNVVPQMMKERKVETPQQLEAALRKEGTTLDRERRGFAEQVLRNSWISQSVKIDQEVTHKQMLDYYYEHAKQYDLQAQARWEQITMRFDRFSSKAEAYAALAQAGNQIVDGRPFAEVARAVSQGSTAAEGGAVDWTTPGSLVSRELDAALFALPVGTLSPIIEDARGFHIIRIVERREAGRKPFTDVQAEIKKKITDERKKIAETKYLEDVRKNAVVWTIYDQPAQNGGPQAGTNVLNARRPGESQR
ncbi:MAG: peptidylprolyl isomerase [Planctomycetaceae bacterium]|nr:peptidylprolyl isomerase [Planctomycetaceae bacterium]